MFNKPLRRNLVVSILFFVSSLTLSAQLNFFTQSTYRYLKGSDAAALPANWYEAGFDESGFPEYFTFSVADLGLIEGENTLVVLACNITLPELIDSIGLSFSHTSGFYDESLNLSITSPVENAEIIYTLDGSYPQKSYTAIVGSSPVNISIDPASTVSRSLTPAVVVRASLIEDGYKASKPAARTFIYLEQVKAQSHPGGTRPPYNNSVRNLQYMDYEMDPEVVNDNLYKTQMDAALLDIPSISVITDNANLFNADTGIYVNAEGQGEEWERECSVELINPDESEGFNINAGLRIRGGWSRHYNYPKHAFRLFFRGVWCCQIEFPSLRR